MPNPPVLICDTDAIAQLFLSNEIRPLKLLRDRYGIQPTIVTEVDLELRWLRRHKDKFVPKLDKALKADVLRVLGMPYFQSLAAAAPAGASWSNFQALGAQYELHIHRGEAYTFAAGITLGVPALSNDFSAIQTLQANSLSLPTPVLRCFDLFAFCFENGLLELKACESARSELRKNGEGVPKAFMNASFEDGLKHFSSRLRTGTVGAIVSTTYSATLSISEI